MEGLRQAAVMMYLAIAEAAGGDDILRRANGVIRGALDDGVIDDPIGQWILTALIDGTDRELRTIDAEKIEAPALSSRIFERLAAPAI